MDSKRIVFIEGTGSEWYEQVIFILKSPGAAKAKNLVFEAEKIINEYFTAGKSTNAKLERYKKSIMERSAAAAGTKTRSITKEAETPATPAAPAVVSTKKAAKRKLDFTSLLINICLILASVLLGYLMHAVMLP